MELLQAAEQVDGRVLVMAVACGAVVSQVALAPTFTQLYQTAPAETSFAFSTDPTGGTEFSVNATWSTLVGSGPFKV